MNRLPANKRHSKNALTLSIMKSGNLGIFLKETRHLDFNSQVKQVEMYYGGKNEKRHEAKPVASVS